MELEIDDLALFRELLALAAVAVAEDVLEPVFGTCFCLCGDGVCCVLCARRRRARRPRPRVCVSDGTIATVGPSRRHRGDAVPATATARVHPRSRRGGGDGVRGSHAIEPTPPRERRRVDGAKVAQPPRRRADAVVETTARRRRRGAAVPRGRQFTPVHTSATAPPPAMDAPRAGRTKPRTSSS